MSSSQTYSPFRSVLLREWRRMTSRRLYLGVCIILPLFTLFFMATIFGNGQMENIPIGIVDQDNTASSRAITRNISAVPTFKVTRHFVNEEAARKAVQKKEIYGYLSIPPKFEQEAKSKKSENRLYSIGFSATFVTYSSVMSSSLFPFFRFKNSRMAYIISCLFSSVSM